MLLACDIIVEDGAADGAAKNQLAPRNIGFFRRDCHGWPTTNSPIGVGGGIKAAGDWSHHSPRIRNWRVLFLCCQDVLNYGLVVNPLKVSFAPLAENLNITSSPFISAASASN